jgi:hypothetical protein
MIAECHNAVETSFGRRDFDRLVREWLGIGNYELLLFPVEIVLQFRLYSIM